MNIRQFAWLRWLADHGGRGRIDGHQVVAADGRKAGGRAAITFLHLVAQGVIDGNGGELRVTEYGRRCLETPEMLRLFE